jgi:hypothetical protein
MRYDEFDGSKWKTKYKEILIPIKNINTKNKTITLRFNYYLDNSRNLFIPHTPLNIKNSS